MNHIEIPEARKLFLGVPGQLRYQDKCARKHSKKYANLDLEVLSHAFTKAIRWGGIGFHPIKKNIEKFTLPARNRYVQDWELEEWCETAPPFLLAYVALKGTTGLRKQDMLTIKKSDISTTELASTNIKTGKRIRFPLYTGEGEPTSVKLALDLVQDYYRSIRNPRIPQLSQFLFHNKKGEAYYKPERLNASSGFDSIWQRAMKKTLAKTHLTQSFTDHDLRSKVVNATPKARLFAAVPILSVFYRNCDICNLNLWALWSISTRVW